MCNGGGGGGLYSSTPNESHFFSIVWLQAVLCDATGGNEKGQSSEPSDDVTLLSSSKLEPQSATEILLETFAPNPFISDNLPHKTSSQLHGPGDLRMKSAMTGFPARGCCAYL